MIADEQTLSRLMAAAQTGDRQAYAVLLAEARRWLLRYLSRKVPPAQVDDLVQEVLVSLHAKRASYDPARPFLPWLALSLGGSSAPGLPECGSGTGGSRCRP